MTGTRLATSRGTSATGDHGCCVDDGPATKGLVLCIPRRVSGVSCEIPTRRSSHVILESVPSAFQNVLREYSTIHAVMGSSKEEHHQWEFE